MHVPACPLQVSIEAHDRGDPGAARLQQDRGIPRIDPIATHLARQRFDEEHPIGRRIVHGWHEKPDIARHERRTNGTKSRRRIKEWPIIDLHKVVPTKCALFRKPLLQRDPMQIAVLRQFPLVRLNGDQCANSMVDCVAT